MQNSLKRDVKFNLDNFNKEFEEKISSEKYNYSFSDTENEVNPDNRFENQYDEISKLNPINLSLGEIIIDLRNMFFIILELISKNKNPINYITSTPKRKYTFSLFLIVFGCLLLLLSTLMMEKKIL